MDIVAIIKLLGGLAFFLFGMLFMGDSIKKVAGSRLELVLGRLTSTPLKGVLLGTFVTAIIQSSSATTVMVVGFVNAGMMKLSQAIGLIMGANIGTTATAWILTLSNVQGDSVLAKLFSSSTFAPAIAAIAIVLYMTNRSGTKRNISLVMLGFSILMTGMNAMSSAVSPLRNSPLFIETVMALSNPLLGILVGIVFTAIIQSASASVGILQALSVTGAITYNVAWPLILGMNIGACVPVLLSAIGANANGKRTALVYLYFNILGTIAFVAVYYLLGLVVPMTFGVQTASSVGIAIVNTVYNVFTTLVLMPFVGVIEKLVVLSIRSDDEEENERDLLEERFLQYPPLAIEQSRLTMQRMSETAAKNLYRAVKIIDQYDEATANKIARRELRLDQYEDKLGTYLVKLSQNEVSKAEAKEISKLLHGIGDYERIGDHALNISELATQLAESNEHFSENAQRELQTIGQAVVEIVNVATEAFLKEDDELAMRVEPLEEVIDQVTEDLKTHHIQRLQEGRCTLSLGFIYNDLLMNYERIADHCSNIAASVLQLTDENFEAHGYLNTLHRAEDPEYASLMGHYTKKYYDPVAHRQSKGENAPQ